MAQMEKLERKLQPQMAREGGCPGLCHGRRMQVECWDVDICLDPLCTAPGSKMQRLEGSGPCAGKPRPVLRSTQESCLIEKQQG